LLQLEYLSKNSLSDYTCSESSVTNRGEKSAFREKNDAEFLFFFCFVFTHYHEFY
jgi:hypothetical protein